MALEDNDSSSPQHHNRGRQKNNGSSTTGVPEHELLRPGAEQSRRMLNTSVALPVDCPQNDTPPHPRVAPRNRACRTWRRRHRMDLPPCLPSIHTQGTRHREAGQLEHIQVVQAAQPPLHVGSTALPLAAPSRCGALSVQPLSPPTHTTAVLNSSSSGGSCIWPPAPGRRSLAL